MTEPTPAAERRYSILVIDDEPDTVELLRTECKEKPYDIFAENNGESGLKAVFGEHPDLILLDYMMPGMDGIEVAKKIKSDPRSRNIPVILLTSYKGTDATVQAFEAGADDYVNKSFEWEEIEARIASMLRKRDASLALEETVATLTASNKQLEEWAVQDDMTGLHNFRAFQQRLKDEWNRAERYKIPLSLILFDLDKFKDVNDNRGHLAGDQVLQEFAMLVTGGARANDAAARYGGEEFAIILPHTDGERALQVAERIRLAVCEFVFLADSRPLRITVSGGVATYHSSHDIESVDTLVGAADKALYRAKHDGRNCIVQHPPA